MVHNNPHIIENNQFDFSPEYVLSNHTISLFHRTEFIELHKRKKPLIRLLLVAKKPPFSTDGMGKTSVGGKKILFVETMRQRIGVRTIRIYTHTSVEEKSLSLSLGVYTYKGKRKTFTRSSNFLSCLLCVSSIRKKRENRRTACR